MAGFVNEVMNCTNVNFSAPNVFTASMVSDGQLIIGSTASPQMRIGTLTAGPGVGITNGAGSITITATGGGLGWVATSSTSVTMAVDTGYIALAGSLQTFTIPATTPVGTTFRIAGYGAGGWVLQCNTGQTVRMGNQVTSSAGTIASSSQGDTIEIVCAVADTGFVCMPFGGNLTYT